MSARGDRRAVIATTSFAIGGELGEQLVGKHPAVVQTGVSSGAIRQGTQLWSDDPIVQAYPSLFADASIVPGAGQSADDGAPQVAGDDPDERVVSPWDQIAEAYRRLASESPGIDQVSERMFRRARPNQPSRPEVASDLGVSPKTITRRCEAAGRGTRWPPRGL